MVKLRWQLEESKKKLGMANAELDKVRRQLADIDVEPQ